WRLVLLAVCMVVGITLALGMAMLLSAVNVRFRDIRNALPLFIQLLLFASPIVYSLSTLGPAWSAILALNPLVGIVEGFRWCIVATPPPSQFAVEAAIIESVILFVAGLVYFARVERVFADVA